MRSTTDAFTNDVVLSTEQTRDWLSDLLTPDGRPPAAFFPVFLHEATHHWCFSSPVHTAVTLLAMRGRVEALLALEASTDAERAVWEKRSLEDLVRVETVLDVYRPLAEGLANYAEFDLHWSVWNRLLPAPLRWAAKFNGIATGAYLVNSRLDEQSRRRKESLLAQPLSCQDGDGYLAGYLTVKALRRRFASEDPDSHWTSDQFLQVLYQYFYEDENLVALLLDPDQRAPGSVSALTRYMGDRIQNAFSSGVASRLVAEYLNRTAEIKDNGGIRDTATFATEDVDPAITALWHQVFTGIPIDSHAGPDSSDLARQYYLLARSRDLMLIGTLPCTVDVADGWARVHTGGSELAPLPAMRSSEGMGIPGTLLVHFATRGGQRMLILAGSAPGTDLLCWSSSDVQPLRRTTSPAHPRIASDTEHSLGAIVYGRLAIDTSDALLARHEEDFTQLRELTRINGYRRQTQEYLNGIYQPCAMFYARKDQIPEVWSRMQDSGFYGLFDRDADAVRALAMAGLLSSVGMINSDLDDEFAKIGTSRSAAIAALRQFAERFGLFDVGDGRLRSVYCTV